MSVITATHMNLTRTRRQMQAAFLAQDWNTIHEWDQLLTAQLNQAFEDPGRDSQRLTCELEKILGLYADIVECLPAASNDYWKAPQAKAPFAE